MRLWSSCRYDGGWWFRLFGVGLSWKDISRHPLLFSERNGYTKGITIRKWRINFVPYKNI